MFALGNKALCDEHILVSRKRTLSIRLKDRPIFSVSYLSTSLFLVKYSKVLLSPAPINGLYLIIVSLFSDNFKTQQIDIFRQDLSLGYSIELESPT